MVEQDYVDFCNLAFSIRTRAEAFFARYGDEHIFQLDGLVRMEMSACPSGKVEPAYDFLAALLNEEAADRRNSSKDEALLRSKGRS